MRQSAMGAARIGSGEAMAFIRTRPGLPAADVQLLFGPAYYHDHGFDTFDGHAFSLAAERVFVPEHRTLPIPDAVQGRSPGRAANPSALWRVPYYPFLCTALAAPAIGVALGALDALVGRADKRIVPPLNLVQANLVRTYRQIGDAEGRVEAARALLLENARRITAHGEDGATMSAADRATCRNNAAFAVELCYEAVEVCFFAAGGGVLDLSGPLQRAMRDIHAIKAHYFMDVETTRELAGMLALGKTPFTYSF